jgi:hypothetical protein
LLIVTEGDIVTTMIITRKRNMSKNLTIKSVQIRKKTAASLPTAIFTMKKRQRENSKLMLSKMSMYFRILMMIKKVQKKLSFLQVQQKKPLVLKVNRQRIKPKRKRHPKES